MKSLGLGGAFLASPSRLLGVTALIQHSSERALPRAAPPDQHCTTPSFPPAQARRANPSTCSYSTRHLLGPQAGARCSVKVRLLSERTTCPGRLLPGNLRVCSAPGLPTPRRNPSPPSEPRAVQTPSFISLLEPPRPLRPGRPPLVVGQPGVRGLRAAAVSPGVGGLSRGPCAGDTGCGARCQTQGQCSQAPGRPASRRRSRPFPSGPRRSARPVPHDTASAANFFLPILSRLERNGKWRPRRGVSCPSGGGGSRGGAMTRWVPTKREEKYGVGELRAPHSAPGLPDLPAARAPEGRRGRAGRGGRADAREPVAAGPARVRGAPSGARASGAGDTRGRGRAVSLPGASPPHLAAGRAPGGGALQPPRPPELRPRSVRGRSLRVGWPGPGRPGVIVRPRLSAFWVKLRAGSGAPRAGSCKL